MSRDVAVIGVGASQFSPQTPDMSYKELMYEAAVKAYEDAGGLNPRTDVDAFISCEEDYWLGISITDEYIPDQIGAVLKPVMTVSADGLWGIINAYMLIKTGQFDVVVVEAHSKASDIETFMDIWRFAFDPIIHRPLIDNPLVIAGLEMRKYMEETFTTRDQLSLVVAKNKRNALRNPLASYGSNLDPEQINESPYISDPLRKYDVSGLVDGSIVFVLAAEEVAKRFTDNPIWIKGVGWASHTPWIEEWDMVIPVHAELAAKMAYKQAGIDDPVRHIDFAEIDDRFSYKELQFLEALGLARFGEAGLMVEDGATDITGEFPVNPSGGYLGVGYPLEAGGLLKAMEVVLQLRGEAAGRQIEDVRTGLAMAWRGIPTSSSAVVIFSNE